MRESGAGDGGLVREGLLGESATSECVMAKAGGEDRGPARGKPGANNATPARRHDRVGIGGSSCK